MPANRKRKFRTSKNRIPSNISAEYIEHLKVSDFLGELTEDEIPLAKELGVYCWDAWGKEGRERRF
jgi:hypothetical protein